MYKYLVIIEKANGNLSAYSPDLPGCIATGRNKEEVTKNMQDAIELHLQGLIEDNQPIPAPATVAEYISIPIE